MPNPYASVAAAAAQGSSRMAKPKPSASAVEETLANRRSLNANQRTAKPRQDLSAAKGGILIGRGGGEQMLGPAAQARLAAGVKDAAGSTPAPAAPVPAWKQLADAGIAGQGSRAANMARLAEMGGASSPNAPISSAPMGAAGGGGMAKPMPGAPGARPVDPRDWEGGAMSPTPEQAVEFQRQLQDSRARGVDINGNPLRPIEGPSGFSPNLPPEIMQRLSALGSGPTPPGIPRGGTASQIAPLVTGAAGGGMVSPTSPAVTAGGGPGPSGVVGGPAPGSLGGYGAGMPNFADYWSQQGTPWGPLGPSGTGLPGGVAQGPPGGGAAGMGPIGSYAK